MLYNKNRNLVMTMMMVTVIVIGVSDDGDTCVDGDDNDDKVNIPPSYHLLSQAYS